MSSSTWSRMPSPWPRAWAEACPSALSWPRTSSACFAPGDHGSTFGGNVLTCAGAAAVVGYVIENDVSANVRAMGQRLNQGLESLRSRYPIITEVRGLGLLLAIQLNAEIAPQLVGRCNEEGLLLNPLRPNAIRLMPPLNVSAEEVDEALGKLEVALKEVAVG